ncbi:MAG: hypothetical protein P0Y64_16645 [Candidatus Sphingomonas colombiensis]|nr:hypothetical protein [Sphingomonas sp.]WEK42948.1 MAG: hypothetical protein P0Y64_16645 [Sphingomonas sp.]
MLSDQFLALMREHDLASLDVSILRSSNDPEEFFWCSTAQAFINEDRIGVQKIADSPSAAVAGAIAELNERRNPAVPAPELEAA